MTKKIENNNGIASHFVPRGRNDEKLKPNCNSALGMEANYRVVRTARPRPSVVTPKTPKSACL